ERPRAQSGGRRLRAGEESGVRPGGGSGGQRLPPEPPTCVRPAPPVERDKPSERPKAAPVDSEELAEGERRGKQCAGSTTTATFTRTLSKGTRRSRPPSKQ